MNKRKALGRGLSNLIPTIPEESTDGNEKELSYVDIDAVHPNPFQPRRDFDEKEIEGLAKSIETQGLLQPVVLRKSGDKYEIISGERRFRAFKRLQRDKLPCIVKTNISDREMLELALVENIQREELNEIEKAISYQKLILEYNYTHEQLSNQIGKSRSVITNSMRLLNLPQEIQDMVRRNELSMGHARALLSLESADQQLNFAKKIIDEKLSVREVEKQIQKKNEIKKIRPAKETLVDPDVAHALEKLQYKFGTSVKLKISDSVGDKGKIEIEYFSKEDLLRIFDLLTV